MNPFEINNTLGSLFIAPLLQLLSPLYAELLVSNIPLIRLLSILLHFLPLLFCMCFHFCHVHLKVMECNVVLIQVLLLSLFVVLSPHKVKLFEFSFRSFIFLFELFVIILLPQRFPFILQQLLHPQFLLIVKLRLFCYFQSLHSILFISY